MKVLVDTNVVLDVLCSRKEFVDASAKILKLCEVKKLTGYISALTVPNIVYIMRKELNGERIKDLIEKLTLIFGIAELKGEDLKRATALPFDDYEDAVQSSQASRIKAEFIVTRNVKDYKNSRVKAITPNDLLKTL